MVEHIDEATVEDHPTLSAAIEGLGLVISESHADAKLQSLRVLSRCYQHPETLTVAFKNHKSTQIKAIGLDLRKGLQEILSHKLRPTERNPALALIQGGRFAGWSGADPNDEPEWKARSVCLGENGPHRHPLQRKHGQKNGTLVNLWLLC